MPTIAEMARARGLGSILPEILPMMPMPRNARPAITNRLSRLISPNTFSQSLIQPPQNATPEARDSCCRSQTKLTGAKVPRKNGPQTYFGFTMSCKFWGVLSLGGSVVSSGFTISCFPLGEVDFACSVFFWSAILCSPHFGEIWATNSVKRESWQKPARSGSVFRFSSSSGAAAFATSTACARMASAS